ncbi:hypothetical protein QAD02_019277 [Eretmocerus hayati]|uniref:Uncharacterized protein n=1 Tax=Eretmocerus hayati TaxID=131215 RepID=A0ACC2PIR2_9HYME|nr:hypothetical protein QAD02_019277 [Eretmocerus hayati]
MTSVKIAARLAELIAEKKQQLAASQNNMNKLFSDLDELEARMEENNNDEDLTFEDVQRLDLEEDHMGNARQSRSRSRSPLRPPLQRSKDDAQLRNSNRHKRERAPARPSVQETPKTSKRSTSPRSQRSCPSSTFNYSDDEGDYNDLDDSHSQCESDISDCDLDQFLGEPLKKSKTLELKPKLAKKVQAWMQSGIQKKEDRQKILDDIPRTGVVNLEAPILNEEIASQLNSKELSRDNFFKLYQTIAGSTISLASSMIQSLKKDVFPQSNVPQDVKDNSIRSLSNIIKLNSDMYQMMCIGRKHFLVGGFEAKTKKALAKAQPTQFLFGDDALGTANFDYWPPNFSNDL